MTKINKQRQYRSTMNEKYLISSSFIMFRKYDIDPIYITDRMYWKIEKSMNLMHHIPGIFYFSIQRSVQIN